MPIPKPDEWNDVMKKDLQEHTNPLVDAVSTLLAQYWQYMAQGEDAKIPVRKQKVLILLLYYCESLIAGTTWKPYVESVIKEVKGALRSAEMRGATRARLASGMGTTLMKEHDLELLQPRDPSAKYGVANPAAIGARRVVGAEIDMLKESESEGIKAVALLRGLNPGAGDFDEVDMLQLLASLNAAGQLQDLQSDLVYLTKANRDNYKLTPITPGLFARGNDEPPRPFTSPGREHHVFVMDHLHFIYVLDDDSVQGTVHHSSVRSGKSVLCAGMIRVVNGVIVFISNGSGHYLPDKMALRDCIQALKDKYQVQCSRIKVEWVYAEDQSVDCGDADNFLANFGAIDQNYKLPRQRGLFLAQGRGNPNH